MKNSRNISHAILRLAMFVTLAGSLSFTANADRFPEPGDFARGSKAWAETCGGCHNIRSPKELRDDQWVSAVFHMRARAGLTGQETRDIITFLQASNATTPGEKSSTAEKSGPALEGKTVYEKSCAACHGSDGKGALPGTPDLTQKAGPLSKSDEELLRNIINGFQSPGAAMAMPPKGGNPDLTSEEIEGVLKYIRETFGS